MTARRRYAEGTSVPAERSKAEIEKLLQRHGAGQFVSGWTGTHAIIGFAMHNRTVRFMVPMPERKGFTSQATYDARVRERWRAMVLILKAKLEAVDSGVSLFEEEFLANIYMPDGKTVGDYMLPQIAAAYQSGKMPKLLPGW